MGSVYRGVHENGGADVAIKIMKGMNSENEERRFLITGKILQRLSIRMLFVVLMLVNVKRAIIWSLIYMPKAMSAV